MIHFRNQLKVDKDPFVPLLLRLHFSSNFTVVECNECFTKIFLISCISGICIKIKVNLNFMFKPLCGASEAFKAIIKLFEAPQRRMKIKF